MHNPIVRDPLGWILDSQRSREAIALVEGSTGHHSSHGWMEHHTTALARRLAALGCGAECRIAVRLPPGVDRVLAVRAVLRIGATLFPLDPPAPDRKELDGGSARLRTLGPRLLITDSPHPEDPPHLELLLLRHGRSTGPPGIRPPARGDLPPAAAAYGLHTSGTSGRPKAVVVSRGAFAAYLCRGLAAYGLEPGDRVAHLAAFGSDFSLCELGLAFASGAALCPLAVAGGTLEGLLEQVHRLRITTLFLPTALWQELARHLLREGAEPPPGLRRISFGGEAVAPGLVRRWRRRFGGRIALWNGYGPTEATVEVSLEPLTGSAARAQGALRVGTPLPDLRVRVLGSDLRPLPTGEVGELCLGGPTLARGYLDRPAETAQRFVPDPGGGPEDPPEPGERLYRTGDRGRRHGDGRLELLGRTDLQVKIRGFRVEPTAVEAHLLALPEVEAAAVVATQRVGGGRCLLAHVVLAGERAGAGILGVGEVGSEERGQKLRRRLAERLAAHGLPAVALPDRVVPRSRLPRTAAGKVDRRRLVEESTARGPGELYRPPETPLQERLAACWAEVLGLPRVGVEEDFFALGGDSILALRLVTRARREGMAFRSRDVFAAPTVARLAARIAGRPAVQNATPELPETARADTGPLPLTPVAHWFFEVSRIGDLHHFNQSVGVRMAAASLPRLPRAAALLVRHHQALRQRFTRRDGRWTARVVSPEEAGLGCAHTIDLGALPRERRRGALEAAADALQRGQHLERGPLLRLAAFPGATSGEGLPLLVAVHHLAVDGVTWGLYLGDLHHVLGGGTSLPQVPVHWRHWCHLQEHHARSTAPRRELPFWASLPATWPPLPVDRVADRRRANTRASHRKVSVHLSGEHTEALLRRVNDAYRTRIDEVLLTALVLAMEPLTGRRDLLLDLEGHGREDVLPGLDLSRTAGWFTTTFPVHLRLGPGLRPGEALRSVKATLRALPLYGIGHGLLRFLDPDPEVRGTLHRRAAPEISFNYLGRLDALFPTGLPPAGAPRGLERTRKGRRDYVLEVDGGIVGGRLWLNVHYSRALHRRATIEALARRLERHLEALIDHCLDPEAGGYSASDFPLAGLDGPALDRLLPRRGVEDVLPLTPLQHGMLFHRLAAPRAATYYEQSSWALRGPLDPATFRRAWHRLAERHGALRTTFLWHGLDEPLQVVHRRAVPRVLVVDLEDLPTETRPRALEALARQDRRHRPAGLCRPPWRVFLLRFGAAHHRLLWSYDHALLDGWSLSRLFDELFGADEVPRPSPPFRQHLAWLRSRDHRPLEVYWRGHLGGVHNPTPLPFDGGTPAPWAPPHNAVRRLTEERTAILEAAARRAGLTLATLVHAAWALVLARGTGETEVLFGTTVSGRPPELEQAEHFVGLLIETLPLRLDLEAHRPTGEWLAEVQRLLLAARENQGLPLVKLRELTEIPPGRPLFESLVVFENYPVAEVAMETGQRRGELLVTDFRGFSQTSALLTLGAIPGERLHLELAAHPGRFPRPAAERLLARTLDALVALAEDTEAPLGRIDGLTSAERHRLLVEWNDTAPAEVSPATMLVPWRWRVEHEPHTVAVVAPGSGHHLSGAGLERAAGAWAAALGPLDVDSETPVATLFPPGVERIAAALGVLARGATWVPLDPALPDERLVAILHHSGARRLLAAPELSPRAESLAQAAEKVRCLFHSSTNTLGDFPLPEGERAAYLLFTSGTSGTPKGVMVSHRALAWYCAASARHYGLGPGERVLQLASIGFDISIGEIFPTLAAGATLVMADDTFRGSLVRIARAAAATRLTVLLPPTAFWHTLAADGEAMILLPSSLRLLSFGGEAIEPTRLAAWRRAVGGRVALFTGYGPTEATVEATVHRLEGPVEAGASPLGRPVDGVRVYRVDRRLRLLPEGSPGELVLGGPGLARGYFEQARLTAERFVPDPFYRVPGARLYRTGDLALHDAAGVLHLRGRLDRQVKLGGLRFEPAEAEALLRSRPGVAEAAVVVIGGESPAAVVFLVPDGQPPDGRELRAFLARHLPPPCVPRAFHALPRLPLTTGGKVDRRALETLALERGVEPIPRPEASDPELEIQLGIWRQVLDRPDLSPDDDFFTAGGHSLLATRLVSHLRRALRKEIPLGLLFDSPTPRTLASALRGLDTHRTVESPERLPVPRRPPLSHAQRQLWIQERLRPGDPGWLLATTLRPRRPLEPATLRAALTGMMRRHQGLRTSFPEAGGAPWQRIHARFEPPLLVVDHRSLPEDRRQSHARHLLASVAPRPFDVTRRPPWRLVLVRHGGGDLLLRVFHHLLLDGLSDTLFATELDARLEGRPLPEAPPFQPVHLTLWQHRRLESGLAEELLGHWRERLKNVNPTPLPEDRPPGEHRAAHLRRPLPAALDAPWERLAKDTASPRFALFLAAFSTALARFGRGADTLLGLPVHGREHPGAEGLLGCFVNTVVLRLPGVGGCFRGHLEAVRGIYLEAWSHRELPFDLLVEALAPERVRGRHPFFEIIVEPLDDPPTEPLGESIPLPGHHGPWALALDLLTRGAERTLEVEYDASRFDHTTVERLLRAVVAVLRAGLADPERPLAELPLLEDGQRHQLLVEWGQGPAIPGAGELFPRLLATAAEARPEGIALEAGARHWSYGALLGRLGRLAHRLAAVGVGADDRVAVFAHRRPATLLRFLAVLFHGAAYVPLAVGDEGPRQVEPAAGARFLLGGLGDAAPPGLLAIDDGAPTAVAPAGDPHPAQLAYVLTTSGSTGRPRAVGISHGALASYCRTATAVYGIGPESRVLVSAPLTFDISVEEIFPALTRGATLVLRGDDDSADAEAFWRLCGRHRIDLASLPTSRWHRLADAVERHPPPPSLRCLVLGGEKVDPERVRRFLEATDLRLLDTYGPTEATVVATGEVLAAGRRPTLGHALPGRRARVVGRDLRHTPPGVAGELVLGGDLARGYLGQPAATAASFVPDPWSPRPGARLYRSGDRARFRPDGRLQFLGRLDRQVKIRGYRVDPAAVEERLLRHPSVMEAAVAGRRRGEGPVRLVAWVVLRQETPTSELAAALRRDLPSWMVPVDWAFPTALPRNAHGKVDLHALDDPTPHRPTRKQPADAVEAALLDALRRALGRADAGPQDDFFALGGDSLLAIRATSLARESGLCFTPADLLAHPSAAELARRCRRSAKTVDEAKDLPGAELPLTPIQHWFFRWPLPRRHHFNQSWLLEPTAPLSPAVLNAAATLLERHHPALRLRHPGPFQDPWHPGKPLKTDDLQGTWHLDFQDPWHLRARLSIAPPSTATAPVIDLSHLPDDRALAHAAARLQASLHLEEGPLLRLALLRLNRGERLLVVVHHLAVDGVSWPVLLGDLETLCRQLSSGRPPRLPEGGTTIATWARRLEHHAASPRVLDEAPAWETLLRGRRPLARAGDGKGPLLQVHRLGAPDTARWLERAARTGLRPDAFLLAALAEAMAPWTEGPELLVELEGHGRRTFAPALDVSRTVGWFTVTHPFAVAPGNGTLEERAERIHRALGSVPAGGLGYGLLRYNSPSTPAVRRLRALDGPEVAFNYLGRLDLALEPGGLFRTAPEPAGPEQGHPGPLTHTLDLNCRVEGGRLIVEWTADRSRLGATPLHRVAERFFTTLRR